MTPDSIHAESTVTFTDSCNQCCCFNFRRRKSSAEKAAKQANKISKQESPRKVERVVTQLHLDISKTEDVEFVQDYKVSPKQEL